jgi:hypothetical protein
MTADLYPPPIPDQLPAAPEPRIVPQRRLHVVDYHLVGPEVRVPSREADALAGHLHGWLYRLQGQDPDERRETDPEQEVAPFAAWLIGDGHPSRRPGQISARVCWYDDGAAQRSIAALARNPTAILGSQPYLLGGISPVTKQPVTAASLLACDEEARLVRLHTVSPVGFRNHTRWHCSLDPVTVLGSALARWLRLWPGSLPVEDTCTRSAEERARTTGWMGRVSVPACELRTVVVQRGKVEQACLRGWAEYDLYALQSSAHRRLVLSLLRGAEVFGLGARCSYGLGAVRVEVVR